MSRKEWKRCGDDGERCPCGVRPFAPVSGVLLYDAVRDRILHAASHAPELAGYDPSELKTLTGATLFGEKGRALLARLHDRMITSGPDMLWGQMLPLACRDGSEAECFATIRLSASGWRDEYFQVISLEPAEAGTGRHFCGAGLNSRFVMEAVQHHLYEYDCRRRLLFYGDSFQRIFGSQGLFGGPGLPFDDWVAMMHPQDAEQLPLHWRRLFTDGQRYSITYRVRDTGGSWHWIHSVIHAVVNDLLGQPRRIVGGHSDVTPALKSERYLSAGEERFRTVFNNVEAGIAVCDPDGRIAQVNPALALMLGRNREHFLGRLLEDFALPEDRAELHALLVRMLRDGRRQTLADVRFVHADGRTVWVNFKSTLSDVDGAGERHIIALLDDVSHTREEREELWFQATHDALTGCWNRRALLERLEEQLQIARRHGTSMAFCICDLDHFKQVNDLHGHQIGDRVLVRFVEILKESVRATEVVGRYGGEEFAVVFPGTSVIGAKVSLERALAVLRRERFVDESGNVFHLTATFGISGATENATAKQVIGWADAALYQGKAQGRNRIVLAQPEEGGKWL